MFGRLLCCNYGRIAEASALVMPEPRLRNAVADLPKHGSTTDSLKAPLHHCAICFSLIRSLHGYCASSLDGM